MIPAASRLARVNRGAARQQPLCKRRAAVVEQSTQHWVYACDITSGDTRNGAAGCVLNQVVAFAGQRSITIVIQFARSDVNIVRDDAIPNGQAAAG